jgi:hypothetical protein
VSDAASLQPRPGDQDDERQQLRVQCFPTLEMQFPRQLAPSAAASGLHLSMNSSSSATSSDTRFATSAADAASAIAADPAHYWNRDPDAVATAVSSSFESSVLHRYARPQIDRELEPPRKRANCNAANVPKLRSSLPTYLLLSAPPSTHLTDARESSKLYSTSILCMMCGSVEHARSSTAQLFGDVVTSPTGA